jgi:hypothetical protein
MVVSFIFRRSSIAVRGRTASSHLASVQRFDGSQEEMLHAVGFSALERVFNVRSAPVVCVDGLFDVYQAFPGALPAEIKRSLDERKVD